MSDTVFDKIIRKEIPADILYEDDQVIVFLDVHPSNPGHTLFVPKEDCENLMSTSDTSLAHTLSVVKKIAPAILTAVSATGFNLNTNNGSTAGQVVMHTHFHLIPRFENDGLKFWGHREVTPEELRTLCHKIIDEIKQNP
ncbi:MAG: HIT family protein [Patescibacteria group bacterium]